MRVGKVLVDSKANLNAQDDSGSTALHYAVQCQHIEFIVLLLDANSDVLKTDHEQLTPLELLSEGKSNLTKAIMILFLRHYQRKGLSMPKRVSEKIGLSLPFTNEDIGSIVNHKTLLNTLHSFLLSSTPTNTSSHSLPHGVYTTAQSSATNMNKLTSSMSSVQLQPISEHTPPPYQPQVVVQPITIYDQIMKSAPPHHSAHPGPSDGSMHSGLDTTTANAINNVAKIFGGIGMPSKNLAADSGTVVTSSTKKPRRAGSMIFTGGNSGGGDVSTNSNQNSAITGNKQPFMTTTTTGAANPTNAVTGNMSMMNLLEEARRQTPQTTPMRPINNRTTSPPKPLFVIKKLEDTLTRSPSSDQQLIQNMKDPNDPTSPLSPSKSRKSRKLAQSMSIVPIPKVSLEEFIQKTMKEEEEKEKTTHAYASSAPSSPANKLLKAKNAVVAGLTIRRLLSAPDVLTSVPYIDNENEAENIEGKDDVSTAPNNSDFFTPRTRASLFVSPLKAPPPTTTAAPIIPPQVNLVEIAFPPADVIPFIPSTSLSSVGMEESTITPPDHLDVVIAVEHCCDCHLHNDQSLRHNPTKYVSMANAVLYSVIKAVAASKLAVRVYALRTKPLTPQRIGAFEVTIAVRVNLPELVTEYPVVTTIMPKQDGNNGNGAGNGSGFSPFTTARPTTQPAARATLFGAGPAPPPPQPETIITMQQQRGSVKWVTHRLFSKLETKSWPNFKTIEQKAVNFIEVLMKDTLYGRKVISTPSTSVPRPPTFQFNPQQPSNPTTTNPTVHHHPGSDSAELQYDVYHNFKYTNTPLILQQEIQEQYQQWIERMKIPPQILRDPLDMEWPNEILYIDYASDAAFFAKYLERQAEQEKLLASQNRLKHPPGPYLDVSLLAQLQAVVPATSSPSQSQQIQKEMFERLVLEHFFVFDARFSQYEKLLALSSNDSHQGDSHTGEEEKEEEM
eukprot:CAMPEP_0173150622 /NCGR_PEP_ID=MMETSP1105-20130129/11075_1 /TAXON_ID=2985 /ORGANISM="Ochromonas sp., Strain BG-1" /LENGTH=953 /DNA_ID=CAMNT_0014065803 /DNA_START=330 /DNA_END=3191 /DNA_ORIENTATION=+